MTVFLWEPAPQELVLAEVKQVEGLEQSEAVQVVKLVGEAVAHPYRYRITKKRM